MTSHKRDSAETGTAFMAYTSDVTAPPADGAKPKLHTLEDIEKELGCQVSLYGHSVTRGSGKTKVTITPAAAAVVYVPTPDSSPENFSHKVLGSWLPCQEEAVIATTLQVHGYARPVFEVISATATPAAAASSSLQASKVIKPINMTGRSSMHLFTSRNIDMPANGWFALH